MIDDHSSCKDGPFTNKPRDYYHIDVSRNKLDIRNYLLNSYLLVKYNRDIELIDNNITRDDNVEDVFYMGLLTEENEKLK